MHRHSHLENFSMSEHKTILTNPKIAPEKSFFREIISAISKKLASLFRREQILLGPIQSGINQEPVNPDWLEEINTATTKDLKKNEN